MSGRTNRFFRRCCSINEILQRLMKRMQAVATGARLARSVQPTDRAARRHVFVDSSARTPIAIAGISVQGLWSGSYCGTEG